MKASNSQNNEDATANQENAFDDDEDLTVEEEQDYDEIPEDPVDTEPTPEEQLSAAIEAANAEFFDVENEKYTIIKKEGRRF